MTPLIEQMAFHCFSAAYCVDLDNALFYSCHSDSVANRPSLVILNPSCPSDLVRFERVGLRHRALRGLLD